MWDRTGLCQKKGFLIKVSLWQYRKSPTYEPSGCELSKMPVYPEKGWRETRGRRSNWRAEEAHNAGDGKGMFFIWEDCSFLRNRTWMQKGPWSLQQPFRMQFSATMSSMMREKATIQMSLDQFFKRGKRIESSNEPEPVPSASGVSETAAYPYLLWLMTLQLHHLPAPLPLPVSNFLASSLDASPCVPDVVLHYCAFQGTVLED